MNITVEYITYNNKEFKNIIPCDNIRSAEILKAKLEKLRHVTEVIIKPIPGETYWVRTKKTEDENTGEWFTAMHDPRACGGWTNQDTWEDFYKEIVEWIHIKKPAIVSTGGSKSENI
jgi:hypothetical protein